MQKKGKKTCKRITALVLCVILLVTSLPLALAVGGSYDPVPVFSSEAREEGSSAWFNDEGGITVRFPQAEAKKSWDDSEQKTIQFYLVELVDLGDFFSVHTENVVLSKTYEPNARMEKMEVTLSAEEIGTLDSTHRYSVTVIAVDSENWFSEPIAATVSDVPEYVYDADAYAPLTEDTHAMREMMRFEAKNNSNSNYSSSGTGGVWDLIQVGDTITTVGSKEQTGEEDPTTGIDTRGYRIRINSAPKAGIGQSFDTAWSRETWDYMDAEEVWYWMDLSQVDLTGLSFRLRSNEKAWQDQGGYNNGSRVIEKDDAKADKYGTVYSTLGYKGNDAYVFVQQTDGSWKKVMMNNGTIDLGHFTGYVRVPLKFICSEIDSYVQLSNQEMGQQKDFTSGSAWNRQVKDDEARAWMDSQYFKNADGTYRSLLVDPAGTPVSEALLLQRRGTLYQRTQGAFGVEGWWKLTWQQNGVLSGDDGRETPTAYMLAIGRDTTEANNSSGKAAYINMKADGTYTIENRASGYKAIEDVMAAGFAYTGIGTDSVDKSIYLDNVLFYRTDNGEYRPNSVSGETRTGVSVDTYYNQRTVIQNVILDAIEKHITTPDYSDFRAVDYIEDLIAGYQQTFEAAGMDTSFLSNDGIAATAASSGRSGIWQNFLDAKQACIEADTYGKANSEAADLLPTLVRTLEKVPTLDDSVITISDQYMSVVIKMYQAYRRLNLSQLNSLGLEEEQRLIKLFNIARTQLGDNTVIVGQQLADFPYITFNNFEQNTTVGQRAWQLENDPTFSSTSDYRHTKGLVTYSTSEGKNLSTFDVGINSEVALADRPNAAWSVITGNGYNGSKGLTTTIDSSFEGSTSKNGVTQDISPSGTYHTVNVSRYSKSAENFDSFIQNNMSDVRLGDLAREFDDTTFKNNTAMPLSLVFYVDFTGMSEFTFAVSIFTQLSDGSHVKARPDMGAQLTIGSNTWWRSFYLLSAETGTWQRVYGDSRYCFSSTSTADSSVNLSNYRGYIAIPLQHFKLERGTTSNAQLNEDATALNNIYAVQFAIGGKGLDEETYTIDNIGFTYDPTYYSAQAAGRNDTSYAEQFGATSIPAHEFVEAVAAINIYNTTTLADQVSAAETQYAALHPYQKGIETVQAAKALLDKYRLYVDSPSEMQAQMAKVPVSELLAKLNDETAYPAVAKNAVVSGKVDGVNHDLPYPGYVQGDSGAEVNYAAYGLTKEMAEAIIFDYEWGYSRYSSAEKAQFSAEQQKALINAYYAAKRCVETMENNLTQATSFYTALVNPDNFNEITLPDDTTQYFAKIGRRAEIYQIYEDYLNIDYYAKTAIFQGAVNPQAGKAAMGLYMWIANTDSVTLANGTQVDGGVLELQKTWQAIYDEASQKIANKQTLSDALLKRIEDAIGYYEVLSSTYANTEELYSLIQAIQDIFPTDTVSLDKEAIGLTSEKLSDTATYKVEYSEQFPVPTEDGLNYITVQSANGVLKDDTFSTDYNIKLTAPDGTVYSKKAADLAAAEFNVGKVQNNAAIPANPQSLQITVSLDKEVVYTVGELTDTLTIKYYRADGTPVTDADGNPIVKTINVTYSMTNTYTVKIPAETTIAWADTVSYDVSYKVTTNFGASNASLDVSVADGSANPYQLTNADADVLTYTPAYFQSSTFGNTGGAEVTPTYRPAVSISDWEGVPVSEYSTTLTYTVTYHPATNS